ncbi:MAG: hypothetical protein LUF90_02290 [Rikenellaceae bacterium]|nr:hypothetical protein [Rikenellaceae bacterium]
MKKYLFSLLLLLATYTVKAEYRSLSTFGADTLRYLEYNFVENNPYNGKTVGDFINKYELPVNGAIFIRAAKEGKTDDLLGLSVMYLYLGETWDATQKYYVMDIYFIPPYEDVYTIKRKYGNYEGLDRLKMFKDYIIDRIEVVIMNNRK